MPEVFSLSDVERMVEASVQELSPLTTMLADARFAQVKAIFNLTEDDLRSIFRVNVFGVYNCYSVAPKQNDQARFRGQDHGHGVYYCVQVFPAAISLFRH